MASRSSQPSSKRPRQDSQSPESAPARKTPRKTSRTPSEATTTSSSTSHVDNDTTMEDTDDFVLFESSAPAPPPQHHHTHPVTGSKPTTNELFAARAQTLATAFNTGRANTPPSQTTNHWTSAPSAPDSRMSGRTIVNTGVAFLRHAGARNNSPVGCPTRGRRAPTDDDDVGSSSRRSSRAEMSPTHHHTGDTRRRDDRPGRFGMQPLAASACREDPFASPVDTPRHVGRISLTFSQAQSMSVAQASPTFGMAALKLASGGTDGSAPGPSNHPPDFGAPRAATYVSHRASFLGASLGHDESSSLYRDPSQYRHPTAQSEDETILERPPTRRGRRTSQDLLRAQEAVRRQKEEDADDELAGNDGEDDEDEVDEENGMDLN